MAAGASRLSPGVFSRLAGEAEFAGIVAATRTGQAVRDGLVTHMRGAIDRPTPWILQQVKMYPATRQRPHADVFWAYSGGMKTPGQRVLRPLEFGGRRDHKRFEKVLIGAGLMEASEYTFPAHGYPLDAHGNIPAKTIVQILSQLKAFGEMGYRANATAATLSSRAKKGQSRYFIPQEDSYLPRGVYERWGRKAIRAVMLFAYKSADYKPTLRWRETGHALARAAFPGEFERAFRAAVGKVSRGRLTATAS